MPVDGERQGLIILGQPLLMEYDGPTRSWKLIVDTELDTVIVVSGTVSLEAGDIQIGAVEIKDSITNDRARVDSDRLLHVFDHAATGSTAGVAGNYLEDSPHSSGDEGLFVLAIRNDLMGSLSDANGDYSGLQLDEFGRLYVFMTGSFISTDTELPDAIAVADGMANPTAPQVLSNLLIYDAAADAWHRTRADLQGRLVTSAFVSGSVTTQNLDKLLDEVTAYITGSVSIRFLDETTDEVTAFVTGSVIIPRLDKDLDEVTAYVTGSVSIDGSVDTELPAAIAAADGMANPTAPQVLSNLLIYDVASGTWYRAQRDAEGRLITSAFVSGSVTTQNLDKDLDEVTAYITGAVGSTPLVATVDEVTAYVTGSVTIDGAVDTELPAAIAAADGMANPTAPQVLSNLLLYNVAANAWDRAQIDAQGRLITSGFVSGSVTIPRLDKDLDEVTAYITGAVGSTPLVATVDEVTAYVTGSLTLSPGRTIKRDVINITGSSAADYMIVTGTSGERVRLMEALIISSNATNLRILSGFTGTPLTGFMNLPNAGDGFFVGSPESNELFHFESLTGEVLVLQTTAGGQLGGWVLWYTE